MQVLKQNKLLGKKPMQFADCVAKSGRTGRSRSRAVRKYGRAKGGWQNVSFKGVAMGPVRFTLRGKFYIGV